MDEDDRKALAQALHEKVILLHHQVISMLLFAK